MWGIDDGKKFFTLVVLTIGPNQGGVLESAEPGPHPGPTEAGAPSKWNPEPLEQVKFPGQHTQTCILG